MFSCRSVIGSPLLCIAAAVNGVPPADWILKAGSLYLRFGQIFGQLIHDSADHFQMIELLGAC